MASASRLPTGDITFLFTDIEGSTALLRTLGDDGYRAALEGHAEIMREATARHGGTEVSTEGDAFFVVFPHAKQALAAAIEAQKRFASHAWPGKLPVRVRMGLHTGEAALGGDNYIGLDVHKAARIASAGHGGQVLISNRTRAQVGDEIDGGVTIVNLGEHRLKDFPQDERIFQLRVPGLRAEFPPLRAVGRTNLPGDLTPFIGRTAELQQARELLSGCRLLTFSGPGGTGKTRFALQLAREVRYDFLDGVVLVQLASISDPDLVATTIADSLEIKLDPTRSALEAVQSFLAIKDVLLVLDNFEQVLQAAPLVSRLLRESTHLKVLVTSREALHVAGEQEFPVPSLTTPGPQVAREPAALQEFEGVALFVQRARAARPDFSLSADNAAAVAAITERLDGLPLAIELAASRIKVLSPDGILQRLETSLDLLATKSADLPARQQTLRNTIKWSYDLLTREEMALFRRAGIFVGGFSLESAESIVADGLELDVLDGIASLVDKSLVRHAEEAREERFQVLDTIREFALEQLGNTGELDAIARLHATHFLNLAEQAAPELIGPEQPKWIERLDREHDNLRAALSWAAANDLERALRAAGALWRFWHFRGHLQEGRDRLESLLSQPQAAAPTAGRAMATDGLAGIVYWLGDYKRAAHLYSESVDIWRSIGERGRELDSFLAIGDCLFMAGDDRASLPYYERGLELARELDNLMGIANASGSIAFIKALTGDVAGARPHFDEMLPIAQQSGSKFFLMTADYTDAWLQTREHKFDGAHERYVEMMDLAQELGDRTGMALALNGVADLAIEQGEFKRALQLAAAAQAIREAVGGGAAPASMRARDPREYAAEALGKEELEEAWAHGLAMQYEEAVALARLPGAVHSVKVASTASA